VSRTIAALLAFLVQGLETTPMPDCPLPRYFHCHAAVALIIAAVLWPVLGLPAGLAAGAAFYVGREFTQWEQGGGSGLPFDWPGLVAPLLACLAVLAVYWVAA
jgi:hypothetical protein